MSFLHPHGLPKVKKKNNPKQTFLRAPIAKRFISKTLYSSLVRRPLRLPSESPYQNKPKYKTLSNLWKRHFTALRSSHHFKTLGKNRVRPYLTPRLYGLPQPFFIFSPQFTEKTVSSYYHYSADLANIWRSWAPINPVFDAGIPNELSCDGLTSILLNNKVKYSYVPQHPLLTPLNTFLPSRDRLGEQTTRPVNNPHTSALSITLGTASENFLAASFVISNVQTRYAANLTKSLHNLGLVERLRSLKSSLGHLNILNKKTIKRYFSFYSYLIPERVLLSGAKRTMIPEVKIASRGVFWSDNYNRRLLPPSLIGTHVSSFHENFETNPQPQSVRMRKASGTSNTTPFTGRAYRVSYLYNKRRIGIPNTKSPTPKQASLALRNGTIANHLPPFTQNPLNQIRARKSTIKYKTARHIRRLKPLKRSFLWKFKRLRYLIRRQSRKVKILTRRQRRF